MTLAELLADYKVDPQHLLALEVGRHNNRGNVDVVSANISSDAPGGVGIAEITIQIWK